MINIPAIQTALRDLVGFEQNTNENGVELESTLTTSESGITVQSVHRLLTLQNILNCVKDSKEDFNSYLSRIRSDAIARLVNRVFTLKHLNENSKELIDEVRLYDGTGNFQDKIVKLGRFVGFRIDMKHSDLCLIMRQIGLQFDTVQNSLPIYIYHTSQKSHVVKLELNYTTANSFAWKALAAKQTLPYVRGGGYIIGYYEDDITGQAIKRQTHFATMPNCKDCNYNNYLYYSKWFKYLSIKPFYVESANLDGILKWNETNEVYTDDTNFGLNLCIGLHCDVSDLFIRNREIFAHALSLQIADILLEEIAFSTRDNQIQQKLYSMALYARGNREPNGPEGIQVQLEKAIKALDFNVSDISPVCMPCNDEGQSLTFKTVFR